MPPTLPTPLHCTRFAESPAAQLPEPEPERQLGSGWGQQPRPDPARVSHTYAESGPLAHRWERTVVSGLGTPAELDAAMAGASIWTPACGTSAGVVAERGGAQQRLSSMERGVWGLNVVGLTRLAFAGTLAAAAAGPEGRGHWALGEAAAMRAGDSSADSDDDAHTGDSRRGPRPGDGIEGRQDGSGGAPSRESRGADEAGGGEAPAPGVRTGRASLRRRNFHIAVGSERVVALSLPYGTAVPTGGTVAVELDFTGAERRCLEVSAALEAEETLQEGCLRSAQKAAFTQRHAQASEVTLSALRTQLLLQLPPEATPGFASHLLTLSWRLVVEFTLVSRRDIAGVWVAFFQEFQQPRCGQAPRPADAGAALAPPLQWALPLEVVAGRAEAMLTWPAEAKRLVLG